MNKNLRARATQLAARPYTIRILRDDSVAGEPLYLALNPELDGCMAQGETIDQAEEYLAQFRIDYIEHLLENNLPVPYPASMATVTGVLASGGISNLRIESKSRSFEEVSELTVQPEKRETIFEGSFKNIKVASLR